MPKGHKLHDFPPPPLVPCDFCPGPAFHPSKWDQRTCPRCRSLGAPDQSAPNYPAKLLAWQIKHGTGRDPLRRARALASRRPPKHRKQSPSASQPHD